MSHVFISYSRLNRAYARQLANHLLSLGFDVWIDDQIDYGDDWWRTIVRAIRGASAFIAIMTDESDASDWVQREVTLADKSHIPAFPLWLSGDFHASENWAIYVRTQFVDVRHGQLPKDDYFVRLSKSAPRKVAIGQDVTELTKNAGIGLSGVYDSIQMTESTSVLKIPDVSALTAAVLKALPTPFEWCFVPGGSVTLEIEPPKAYSVDDFLIAKYTITNAQFQVFAEAKDGYGAEKEFRWYDFSEEARNYRTQNSKLGSTAFKGDNLPRTNVSWYDAVAFTRWLSNKTGQIIALPTEQQWQRAAVGDTGWEYPWGDTFDQSRCCFNAESPVAVTEYANGSSPYGVVQMSGNVWEWCSTDYESPDNAVIKILANKRVLRGGSWNDSVTAALRAAYRIGIDPNFRRYFIGFRCAVSALFSGL